MRLDSINVSSEERLLARCSPSLIMACPQPFGLPHLRKVCNIFLFAIPTTPDVLGIVACYTYIYCCWILRKYRLYTHIIVCHS